MVGYLRTYGQAALSMAPLVRTATAVVGPWKGGTAARSTAIASGLLDLNIDAIAQRVGPGGTGTDLVSLVDALPSDRL
jgi:hypothetical protein